MPDFLSTTDPKLMRAHRDHLGLLVELPGATVTHVPMPVEWELLTGTAVNNVSLPEQLSPSGIPARGPAAVRRVRLDLARWATGVW